MIKRLLLIVFFFATSIVCINSSDEYSMICGARFKSWYFHSNLYNGYQDPLEDSVCFYGKELKIFYNRTHTIDTTCANRGLFSQPEPFKIFYVTVQDSSEGATTLDKCNPKWVKRRMISILRDTFELQMPAFDRINLSKRYSVKLTPSDGPVFYQEGKMTLVWISNKSKL